MGGRGGLLVSSVARFKFIDIGLLPLPPFCSLALSFGFETFSCVL